MASPAHPSPAIRFGAFELDPASGELRKAGVLLKLHPQPFRVLVLLAQRPGQIVHREEIQHCLWGDNTFVDFEGGINFCVKQMRAALGDDAEKPRYIETLPRRGYRFIASVSLADPRKPAITLTPASFSKDVSKPAAAKDAAEFSSARDIHVVPSPFPDTFAAGWNTKTARVAIVALSVIAMLAAGASFYFRRPPKLTERDTVVLAEFSNTTGDTVFDDALKQALATELGQSPFLNVLSDRKVSETLRMMGRPGSERVTLEVGRELCLRTGSKALLGGAISSVGSHYLVGLDAVACGSGETLAQEQVEARSKEDVLNALSRAASRLRTKLGESLPSVQKFDVPIEATTTSLEALKSYSMAIKVVSEQGEAPSIPFLKRAVELDPNFAVAYAALARRYNNLNQHSLALVYAAKAYELRDRVTEREKLGISVIYFRAIGDMEKLAETFELWTANYPRGSAPHGGLCASYAFLAQYEKALAECREAVRLNPDVVANYENLSDIYRALDRLDEVKATIDQALARKLDSGELRENLYELAFLRGDSGQMEQQVAWGAGKPGEEDLLLSLQSDTEAYHGRVSKARVLSRRAVDSAVRADLKEIAALRQVIAALREAEFGNGAEARQGVAHALALAEGRDVKIYAAMALARTGEIARARGLVEELEKRNPDNTLLKIYWLPVINAAIALEEGNSSRALGLLETAQPYELGQSGSLERGTLYAAYLRGQAYLLAHNATAAAAEFQKLMDHPGIVGNFVTGPLARMQLARAYAMAGERAKAKKAHEDFLALWKDADPDIPILKRDKIAATKSQ
jgi:DNA-binding winged helix-turn-helix (wHTH) protein/tetratricopeptide (TPR) repeat protein